MRTNIRAAYRATVLAGIAAIASPAFAQDDTTPDSEAADGEADESDSRIIIVTSERRAMNLQDTPLSVVAITGDIAEAKGIDDLEDLAKFTPNLSISPTRGGGNNTANFVIRGVAGGGGATGERGVGLYLDGIYMPRTSGAVLRVLDIDRVEVLRGPQGTLFGRNSTGGAIRIFSKQPTDVLEGSLRATVANMDRVDLVGTINLPVAEGVAIRAQGAYLDQGGFVQRGTEELGEERDIIGRLQLRIEPSDRLRMTFGLLYNESKANGTPLVFTEFDMRDAQGRGVDGVIQGNYADWINDAFKLAGQAPLAAYNNSRIVRGPFQAPDLCFLDDFNPDYDAACNQSLKDKYWQADLNLHYEFSDNVSLTSITGYSELTHRGISDFQVLGTESRGENVESEVLYQELQINAALFGGAVDLVAGGNYFHEDSSAPNFTVTRRGTSVFPSAAQQNAAGFNVARWANGDGNGGLYRVADTITSQVSTSWGIFASATWHVTDRLNLTGGLRQAWDKKSYDQTRSPGTPGITSTGNTPTFTTTPEFTVAPGTTSTTVNAGDTFKALDWRGTIDYHITDDVMAYATVSKAYKAGAFSYTIASWTAANQATGAAQSAGIVPIPNEEVINYEAGLRMSLFDNRLRLNPTVFRMDFTNRQAAVQVTCNTGVLVGTLPSTPQCPVGFLILVQNQGDVRLEGFEFDAQMELAPWFIIDGGVAITKPTLKNAPAGTVNLFPDVPSPTFNLGATWLADLPFGNLTANANYAYVGEQETHPTSGTDSAYTLPDYGLVNVRLQLELHDIPVTITAFANNLFDKVYATYGQRFGGGFWDSGAGTGLAAPLRSALSVVRGRPREVGLSLQYDF